MKNQLSLERESRSATEDTPSRGRRWLWSPTTPRTKHEQPSHPAQWKGGRGQETVSTGVGLTDLQHKVLMSGVVLQTSLWRHQGLTSLALVLRRFVCGLRVVALTVND